MWDATGSGDRRGIGFLGRSGDLLSFQISKERLDVSQLRLRQSAQSLNQSHTQIVHGISFGVRRFDRLWFRFLLRRTIVGVPMIKDKKTKTRQNDKTKAASNRRTPKRESRPAP
jgi:hypothetical protein